MQPQITAGVCRGSPRAAAPARQAARSGAASRAVADGACHGSAASHDLRSDDTYRKLRNAIREGICRRGQLSSKWTRHRGAQLVIILS